MGNFIKLKLIKVILAGLILFVYPFNFVAGAEEDKITLTISPPLVNVKLSPGNNYTSFVKLVNNSLTEVTVFIEAADFKSGAQGVVEFIYNEAGDSRYSLSRWLEFATSTMVLAAQETKDIVFTVNVPVDAEPGGHYAAILAGTKPIGNLSGSGIKINSTLASLVLLEVKGDIDEKGEIKEFSSSRKVYSQPQVKFKVTFANNGNIHLQPRGEIKIYNIFNKEIGSISINQETAFGNVFPESQRQWEFSWNGRKNILDAGRLKAVLFLSYGSQAEVTASQTIYFWIIYFKTLAAILLGLAALIAVVMLLIRRYIRKAIIKAQVNAGVIIRSNSGHKHKISVIPETNNHNGYQADIKVRGDKNELNIEGEKEESKSSTLIKFLLATLSALILVFGLAALLYYRGYLPSLSTPKNIIDQINDQAVPISDSLVKSQEGDIDASDKNREDSVGLSDEYETETSTTSPDNVSDINQAFSETIENKSGTSTVGIGNEQLTAGQKYTLTVLNGNGQEGAAKKAEAKIIAAGFTVTSIGNADNYNYINTVVKYKRPDLRLAENIGEIFGKKVELQEIAEGQADIIVIIGQNFQ